MQPAAKKHVVAGATLGIEFIWPFNPPRIEHGGLGTDQNRGALLNGRGARRLFGYRVIAAAAAKGSKIKRLKAHGLE